MQNFDEGEQALGYRIRNADTSSLTSSSGIGLVATEGSLFVRRFTADRRKIQQIGTGGSDSTPMCEGKSLPYNVSRRHRYGNCAGN